MDNSKYRPTPVLKGEMFDSRPFTITHKNASPYEGAPPANATKVPTVCGKLVSASEISEFPNCLDCFDEMCNEADEAVLEMERAKAEINQLPGDHPLDPKHLDDNPRMDRDPRDEY